MGKKKNHYRFRWQVRNILLFVMSLFFAFYFSRFESVKEVLLSLGDWGYVGAFFAGMLFVSSFTVALGVIIIFTLAQTLTAWEIGLIAGMGGVLGDFLIFNFVKDHLVEEIVPIYNDLGGRHLTRLLKTSYFSWTLPVVGALIIASPFPDEVGVSLLGISKMNSLRFLLLSFVLNATGIFLVVLGASLF